MPFPNFQGPHKLWTREKVITAMAAAAKELRGPLPCCDEPWGKIKKGRYDWPPSARVYEHFKSFARAWLAAGVRPSRITLSNNVWAPKELEYLKTYAGEVTLTAIAKHLHRSYQAIRAKLNKDIGVQSRHNQGYFSAAELSKEYQCPYHRIRELLASNTIPGTFDRLRNRWQVDLAELTPSMEELLRKPKGTWKAVPADLGDYYQRYGIIRHATTPK